MPAAGDGGGVCVLGAGAWGTALAIQAARAGAARVALWARDPARAAAMAAGRENARHLPGAALPDAVGVTADADGALSGAEVELPEGLAGTGLTNELTGEPVAAEARDGAAVLRADALLRGFPVALLTNR